MFLKVNLIRSKVPHPPLQNKDLFDARKVTLGESESKLTATAETGALTGDFNIEVVSIATHTEISSSFRTDYKLSSGLDLDSSLKDLPLSMKITTGTFTISGKTFNISSLDSTLREILDEINTINNGVSGVNPENDNSGVTLQYNQDEDKMHLDATGNGTGISNYALLGSPTDSSNFLEALKLVSAPQSGVTKSTSTLAPLTCKFLLLVQISVECLQD